MENAKLTRKLRKIMKIFVITPRIETFKYTFKTDGLHSRSDRSSQQQEPSIKTPFSFNVIAKTEWSEIPICNFLNRTAKKFIIYVLGMFRTTIFSITLASESRAEMKSLKVLMLRFCHCWGRI